MENRKEEHIRIAEQREVSSSHNYWDDITFIHKAVPEVDYDKIKTSVDFLGKKLKIPMIISSMTGGTELAMRINKNLAAAAEKFGIGMGLGSMRAAVEKKELSNTFSVINNYKIPMKIANIGAPQLLKQEKPAFSDAQIEYVFNLIGADFLAIHFNFLQEMVQPEGDRNSKGVLKRLKDIAGSYPIIAKETGNGFSREDALNLIDAGVKAIDVGGLGGTSFSAIEYYRAEIANDKEKMRAGKTFWDWGIPSPVSILECMGNIPVIGSGGLRNGLDLARAIMMGADIGGFARSLLSGADQGQEALDSNINITLRELKIAMLLTGSKNVLDLRNARNIITGKLRDWIQNE
ncbi:MAG: type 2 isopentenyl-diphosphate Delta-isomerase [Thermoplasmataceae archaeon]